MDHVSEVDPVGTLDHCVSVLAIFKRWGSNAVCSMPRSISVLQSSITPLGVL